MNWMCKLKAFAYHRKVSGAPLTSDLVDVTVADTRILDINDDVIGTSGASLDRERNDLAIGFHGSVCFSFRHFKRKTGNVKSSISKKRRVHYFIK